MEKCQLLLCPQESRGCTGYFKRELRRGDEGEEEEEEKDEEEMEYLALDYP